MFDLNRIENGRMNVPEPSFFNVKKAEAVEVGEALVLTSGELTKCGADAKPQFIAMRSCGTADKNREIPVCRVEGNQLYVVPVSAAPSDLKCGDKVTLHTDGLQVTATTESGVVTVVDLLGATVAGDLILVRIE